MVVIRKAREADAKSIIQLHKELGLHERGIDELVNPNYLCEPVKRVAGRNVVVFIAEDGNKIIGFASAEIKSRGPLIERVGHYNDCYVKEEYRRRGIAKKLTMEILKWFKSNGVKHVELFVSSKNKIGIKLWKSFGFNEIGKFMRKRL
ncbi:MAG: GNAT family N-acetyltransferase [Nanoarchaeota archaeon]|nr:GNAT family N-acetyltransferase [Nanoarchaeota archaeon]